MSQPIHAPRTPEAHFSDRIIMRRIGKLGVETAKGYICSPAILEHAGEIVHVDESGPIATIRTPQGERLY